jgi:CubicO group peptidase (beta-lactamase class C family)
MLNHNYIKMKKTSTLLFLVISLTCFSQTHNQLSDKAKNKIDSTYNALLKKNKVIGLSLAIVDKDGIIYSKGYGLSDVKNKVEATDKTIYRIGSMTKSFTALSIMQLQEKNLVNTNSSLRVYLPELKIQSRFNDNNPLYVKDVLAHISGLPSDVNNGFFCDSPPDMNWLINELNKQVTSFPANYVHSYSNIGYGLLGELIARADKTTYSDYVKNNIFIPLNMTSSYINEDASLSANFSKAYINKKETKEPLIRDQAAGLIHSNVLDIANYVRMYLNKGNFEGTKLVNAESIDEMTKNRLETLELNTTKNWGFGLYTQMATSIKEKDSLTVSIIGHGGDTYAFHSDMAFIPELGVGVVILTNSDKGAYINDAKRLLKLYLKEEKSSKLITSSTKKNKNANDKSKPCTVNQIKGTYNSGDFVIHVTNPKKISFKQGPAKLKFTLKKGDSTVYTAKARVFKVIPINLKDQEFKFVSLNNHVYLKQVNVKSGSEIFAVMKDSVVDIPKTWKTAYGTYKIKSDYYTCTKCAFGNPEGTTLHLSEKKGLITFKLKAKGMSSTSYLNVISDSLCVTGGISRGCGETVKLLSNGNIYYSGFEFERR